MKAKANLSGDVTVMKKTFGVDVHAVVKLPRNPLGVIRCVRGKHEDCNVLDHVDVVDFDVTPKIR